MPKCYLAGPMRGIPNLNFPEFNRMSNLLRKAGWYVISPVDLDIDAGEPWTSSFNRDWANEEYVFTPEDCRRMVIRDVNVLLGLRPEEGDALIVMDGWENSVGAMAESHVGHWLKLQVLHIMEINELKFNMHLIDPPKGRQR